MPFAGLRLISMPCIKNATRRSGLFSLFRWLIRMSRARGVEKQQYKQNIFHRRKHPVDVSGRKLSRFLTPFSLIRARFSSISAAMKGGGQVCQSLLRTHLSLRIVILPNVGNSHRG
jgi:hypothetical protein